MFIVKENEIPRLDKIEEPPIDAPLSILKKCLEMEALCEKEKGIGLAATQVGIPWNVFVIKHNTGKYGYYVNCKYEPITDQQFTSLEGCLSLRDKHGDIRRFEVPRHLAVKVSGKKLEVNNGLSICEFSQEIKFPESIVFQHEIDHGFGILISEIGKEVFIW